MSATPEGYVKKSYAALQLGVSISDVEELIDDNELQAHWKGESEYVDVLSLSGLMRSRRGGKS